MMNYPNGLKKSTQKGHSQKKFSNRGMTLEEDINLANKYYLDINKAVIHKKPTPVQVVRVHYPKRSAAVVTEGYFKQASTTDYNGIYRGKYIDFEAKETKNKTAFPLANIHAHQIEHIRSVAKHGGISFVIVRFTTFHETYLLKAEHLLYYWDRQQKGGRKSIPYKAFKSHASLIPIKFQPRIAYLDLVDELYF